MEIRNFELRIDLNNYINLGGEMRLHFLLTPNTQTVPFDYQHFLIGAFHKWMGWNEVHDEISLYSLSWLQGGKMFKDGFNFT